MGSTQGREKRKRVSACQYHKINCRSVCFLKDVSTFMMMMMMMMIEGKMYFKCYTPGPHKDDS